MTSQVWISIEETLESPLSCSYNSGQLYFYYFNCNKNFLNDTSNWTIFLNHLTMSPIFFFSLDPFLPCPDNLLVNLHESKELVIELLNQLPTLFEGNHETGSALGAALQSAHKLMVGLLLIFL